MQLFLFFFGVALFGIDVDPWIAAWLALTFWTSAFLTDIWRGCVEAIPKGQWEASETLALSYVEQMRYVILPQAGAHRDRADRRLLGAGHQGHRARLHHRLRRPDQGRHHAQQRDLPALPGLFAGGADLFRALLPALLVRASSGKAVSMPLVDIVDVRKSFGPTEVLKGVSVECRARRRGRDHRPLRLGQVDAASLHQRARDLRCRRHRRRRHRCRPVGEGRKAARPAPQCRHGVSAIQSVPASHRGRERDAGADAS